MICHIKELRKKNNLTQRQLAVRMDTSESLISRWENGDHLPSLPLAYKLSKVLNCTMEELYDYE